MGSTEFSFDSREKALEGFKSKIFDFLIVGGGITGAAVAKDAASRGLKVALVDKNDFAFGTSSRSSKLIHGGLRYLENFEFGLVFESLAERALLLKSVPHMVKPLPFYLPVYKGDRNGRFVLSLGLFLYDILALFRTPEFHRGLSKKQISKLIPSLRTEGLTGGFKYYDASMWDDVLTVETVRAASMCGANIANYVEAVAPIWKNDRIVGFRVRDLEKPPGEGEVDLRAKSIIICAGPWTDKVGRLLSPDWQPWLSPSRGVHLVFDIKRLPVPGAIVMSNKDDGRISFVIPRQDFGSGVVIVGTTDGPSNPQPENTQVESSDVKYLMDLLNKYFPSCNLTTEDILSAYVGVRPLIGGGTGAQTLQKVSREHRVDRGPGGTVVVAGGKYTTHRKMAEEIVDFSLSVWKEDYGAGRADAYPNEIGPSRTKEGQLRQPEQSLITARKIPKELVDRYGADANEILDIHASSQLPVVHLPADPEGFPYLAAQLRYAVRNGMVLHLDDFYFRRTALFAARKDHGLPWAMGLARILLEEMNLDPSIADEEVQRLNKEVERRTAWIRRIAP